MSQKRQDIQGVRAWAIALVLLFHFFPSFFPNGYLGVDMFFVVSGFLMAMIISKSEDINIATFKSFYYKRIKRILPLYYLVLFFILLVVLFALPSSFRSLNLRSSQKAIFLFSNIREIEDINQRYENMLAQAEDLFTHTWSLAVEMQWYLLVPLVYCIQRLVTNFERAFFFGVAVLSFILYLCLDLDSAFYNVFARMWQFCCGILAFTWSLSERSHPERSESEMTVVDVNNQFKNIQETTAKGIREHPKIRICITLGVFVLAVAVPFLMYSLPARYLRVETTIATAILLYLGKEYQTILLTKSELVYIGDISYAFYLYHWPVHIVFNHYYSENPLGPIVGIFVSGFLAALTYSYYEKNYLRMSQPAVISLILVLLCACVFLSLQPERVDDLSLKLNINLSQVDVNDAAWNMTLMRYLIAKEGHGSPHMYHKECTYSDRFLNKTSKPTGFCAMKKGGGKYNFLVLGNSFACNQGDVVYKAFKVHANEFNVFCVPGCEIWILSRSHCASLVNYTAIIEELKPDIVFFINRHIKGKDAFDGTKPLSEDIIYRNQTRFLNYLEKVVKKVYIVQALPRCKPQCPYIALKYTEKGKALNTIKDGLIVKDDFFARQRIWEIGLRCKNCEIVDYMPALVDENGEYFGYDPKTNLMFIDVENHFNNFGKARIQKIFNRLSKDFTNFEKT